LRRTERRVSSGGASTRCGLPLTVRVTEGIERILCPSLLAFALGVAAKHWNALSNSKASELPYA